MNLNDKVMAVYAQARLRIMQEMQKDIVERFEIKLNKDGSVPTELKMSPEVEEQFKQEEIDISPLINKLDGWLQGYCAALDGLLLDQSHQTGKRLYEHVRNQCPLLRLQ